MTFRAMPKKIPGFGAGPIAPVRSLRKGESDKKLQFFETALALNEHRRSPQGTVEKGDANSG